MRGWAGVSASSVAIYRLEAPVVVTSLATLNVAANGTANLASLFSATDLASKAIASFQAYSASATGFFSERRVDCLDVGIERRYRIVPGANHIRYRRGQANRRDHRACL